MGAASVTVASVPRNWGGQQLLDDVLMVTETELHPNVLKVCHLLLPLQFKAGCALI
jgi:hypothetical protein